MWLSCMYKGQGCKRYYSSASIFEIEKIIAIIDVYSGIQYYFQLSTCACTSDLEDIIL